MDLRLRAVSTDSLTVDYTAKAAMRVTRDYEMSRFPCLCAGHLVVT